MTKEGDIHMYNTCHMCIHINTCNMPFRGWGSVTRLKQNEMRV